MKVEEKQVTVQKFIFDSKETDTLYEVLDDFIDRHKNEDNDLIRRAKLIFDQITEGWEDYED